MIIYMKICIKDVILTLDSFQKKFCKEFQSESQIYKYIL